jgi:hypothetical protein
VVPESITFDEAVSALDSWIGEPVQVSVNPAPGSPSFPSRLGAGTAYAKFLGHLGRSDEGAQWAWRGPNKPEGEVAAFQVGETAGNYFVLHKDLATGGHWVSREHRFFILEMVPVYIGVEVYTGR